MYVIDITNMNKGHNFEIDDFYFATFHIVHPFAIALACE